MPNPSPPRRKFLKQAAFAAAAGALSSTANGEGHVEAPPTPLPTMKLGGRTISRLVAGWNPIAGHSHTTLNLAKHMREYFTDDRTVQFAADCHAAGITTWQVSPGNKASAVLERVREEVPGLSIMCLHAEKGLRGTVQEAVNTCRPFAMAHHGNVTDAMFRAGYAERVHDYVKKVHDAGVAAGVSAHNPENIKRIADAGWEVDFFMTCFYYISRPKQDQEEQIGKVTVGEPFFESDPVDMTEVVRQVDQPCLGFKILAAGRKCWSRYSVKRAFEYAFKSIKPIDGVIVGMYPRFHDEIADNVKYVMEFGQNG